MQYFRIIYLIAFSVAAPETFGMTLSTAALVYAPLLFCLRFLQPIHCFLFHFLCVLKLMHVLKVFVSCI